MSDEPVTLEFSSQTLRSLVNEVASLRDDTNVLAAIVRRMDNSQSRILDEVRAVHAQQQRIADRVRQLEAKSAE